jgi:hypothetical protein
MAYLTLVNLISLTLFAPPFKPQRNLDNIVDSLEFRQVRPE